MLVIVCLFVTYSLNYDQNEQQQGDRSSLVRASLASCGHRFMLWPAASVVLIKRVFSRRGKK